MTFTTDGTCVVKMECSDEEISAVLAESSAKMFAEVGEGNGDRCSPPSLGNETPPSSREASYLEEDLRFRSTCKR